MKNRQRESQKGVGAKVMKRIISTLIIFTMLLSLVACGSESHEGQAKTPSGSSVQKGRNYEDVKKEFEDHGFTNISFEKLEDLVTGWMTKDGSVESVSVDGDENYSPDKWYPNDVPVIITYHTFAEKEENTNDISEESHEQTTNEENGETTTETPKEESETLTVENCDDLRVLLSTESEIDPLYSEFAEKYKNQTIVFDGYIYYFTNHGDYDTRYDIMLQGGDFINEDTVNNGPVFKFEDVSTRNLGIEELYLPSFVKTVGTNVRVTAIVREYNEDTGIFFLKPVLLEER